MSEKSSSPKYEWKNVSNEQIEDPEKAKAMAKVEHSYRSAIEHSGPIALQLLNPDRSGLTHNLQHGPEAVELAGQEYDEAKKQAPIDEKNRLNPNSGWRNVSSERIDDQDKAHYMANVENAWRNHIDTEAQKTRDLHDKLKAENHVFTDHVTDESYTNNRYDAQVYGPRAVEETGKAYDALHNPTLPAVEDEEAGVAA